MMTPAPYTSFVVGGGPLGNPGPVSIDRETAAVSVVAFMPTTLWMIFPTRGASVCTSRTSPARTCPGHSRSIHVIMTMDDDRRPAHFLASLRQGLFGFISCPPR